MRTLVLFATFWIAAVSVASAADCDACMPTKACIRHQKEQDEVMAQFKKLRKDKDPMRRKLVLDKLGALNDSHLNYRSADVAKCIADMLDDVDTGIRLAAVEWLRKNQNEGTAKEELSKLVTKLLPAASKPRPGGKTLAPGPEGLVWDNDVAMVKVSLDALATFGGKDCAPQFVDAIDGTNLPLACDAIKMSARVKSKDIVEAYLKRFAKLQSTKVEEEKVVLLELAHSFMAETGFAEPVGDNASAWLKKAQEWWRPLERDFEKPPADPPKDGGAK